MNALPPSLSAWENYPQFVLCKGKVPVDLAGQPADFRDPDNWHSSSDAISYANLLGFGVGFVFTADDPFWFLDIDHCVSDGAWTQTAEVMLQAFAGCAMEISTSGEGLHIFGTGTAPPHAKKNTELGIEFYTEVRVALLTGNSAQGDVQTVSPHLPWLVETYFPLKSASVSEAWRDTPVPEWNGPEDDDALIDRMLSARGSPAQQLGGRATIADLWYNNEQALAHHFESETDTYNRSSADAALASHLAWWTGKNHARIWNLMFRSALRRDKWDRQDYMVRTISNAVDLTEKVYGDTISHTKTINAQEKTKSNLSIKHWGDLSGILFDPMKWVIKSFLPPGVSLIAGRPKQGKSWLVHAIALLVAAGRPVFGYVTFKSDVLYMALEDSERRLQGRTHKLMRSHGLTDADINGFHYCIDALRLGEGLEEYLDEILGQHSNIRLVIIDVLARIRTPRKGNQSVYEHDYEVGRKLKEVGKIYPDVAFLIVHHQNKGQGDALDSISGTHGLAGGFDNTYGLVKGESGLEMHIDGRDIEDSSPIPLSKRDDGMWTLASRSDAAEAAFSDTRAEILAAIGEDTLSPKEIAEITALASGTVSASLRRMLKQGIVTKHGHGKYHAVSLEPYTG